MPKVAELKEIDGHVWARLEMTGDQGSVTFWTEAEKKAAIRDHMLGLAEDENTVGRVADEIKGTILKDDMDCEHVLTVTPSAPRQFFERLVMKAAKLALSTLTAKE